MEITAIGGRVLECTVHGQKGSMHDPLSDAEIERKFETLAGGRLDPGVPETGRSLPDRLRERVDPCCAQLVVQLGGTGSVVLAMRAFCCQFHMSGLAGRNWQRFARYACIVLPVRGRWGSPVVRAVG